MDEDNERESVDLPDLERRHRHAVPPLPRDFFPIVRNIFKEIDSELEKMDPRSTDYYELQKLKTENLDYLNHIVRRRIKAILDSAFSEALKNENVDLSEASIRKNFLREENAIIRMIALIINAYYKHVIGYVKALEDISPETFSDGLYSRIVPIILGMEDMSVEETQTQMSHDVTVTDSSQDEEITPVMSDDMSAEVITEPEENVAQEAADEEEFTGLVEEEPPVTNPVRKEISRDGFVLAYSDNDITIPIGDDRGDFELMIEENSVLSLKEDTGIGDFIVNGLLKDIPVEKGDEDGD